MNFAALSRSRFPLYLNLLSGLAFALACVIIFIACIYFSIQKPLTLDETDIAMRSHIILNEGPFSKTLIHGGAAALTHPPLYDYLMAGIFKLFGESDVAARGLGVFFFFFIYFFSAGTLGLLLRDQSSFVKRMALIAHLALFLVNPLLIQHSMLIDADTTGTALGLTLFVFIFIKSESLKGQAFIRSRLLLGLIFAVTFLFKELSPFMIWTAIAVYRVFRTEWKRLFWDALLILGFGMLLAWSLWWIYCQFLGLEATRILQSQTNLRYSRFQKWDFILRVWKAMEAIIRWPIFWTTGGFALLYTAFLASRIWRWIKVRNIQVVDMTWMVAMVIWLPFLFFKPSIDMMKYQYPVYPLMIVGIVYFLVQVFARHQVRFQNILKHQLLLGLGVLLFMGWIAHYYFGIGDYLIYLWDSPTGNRWNSFSKFYFKPFWMVGLAGLVFFLWKRKHLKEIWAGSSFLIIFPMSMVLSFHQMAPYTTAESWLNYGENGMKDTVAFLSRRVHGNRFISARKDIVYYLRDRHDISFSRVIEPQYIFASTQPKVVEIMFQKFPIDFIVMDRVSLFMFPQEQLKLIGIVLNKYYEQVAHYGDFRIFKSKKLIERNL